MAHYGLQRIQHFLFQAENFDGALWIAKDPMVPYFRLKTLMAHYGLPRTQCFLFQAENFDGALWIAKDPMFLTAGGKL